MKNKIGWCDMTFNPCWGCNNHCEYCYARKIAKRFWAKMIEIERDYHFKKHQSWAWTGDQLRDLHDFLPTWLEAQFDKKFPKKTQKIFVGSMSEIYYWKEEWMERVIEKIKQYPQHTFIFLTKFPFVYSKYNFPDNCWLGCTVINKSDFDGCIFLSNQKNLPFISFEPLFERIIPLDDLESFDWVIIGAETGNRKGKIIPKKEWVEDIVGYCRYKNIPVYLKDSLKNIYPVEIKEFPEVK